jgi:predicted RNA-binding protein with PIN domain
MALVRILVDGYSLLHAWEDLAPGKPRHSAAARDELLNRLTQYYDACGTPITVVFDGASGETTASPFPSTPDVEIIYSRQGQTADQVIERVAHRLVGFGEVLVVTDDLAERDTVASAGGTPSSCLGFIQTVESALAELEREVKNLNRRERTRFQRSR